MQTWNFYYYKEILNNKKNIPYAKSCVGELRVGTMIINVLKYLIWEKMSQIEEIYIKTSCIVT